jgi:enamine deaminase RidA (YjgF/YER057c/UK114 family)
MRIILAAYVLALAAPTLVLAQTADYPRRLPTPGGEVVLPGPGGQRAHDEVGYAPARRAGDTLYISGAIVGRAPDEGNDAAAFETQVRRTLTYLDRTAAAAGASLDDVIMINSFHVWDGPNFAGTKTQQIEIIARVWREFSDGPRPAWSAVGTTGLLSEGGIVEIQLIVHSPAPES